MATNPIDYLGALGGIGPSYQDQEQQAQVIQNNRNVMAAQQRAAQLAQQRAAQKQQMVGQFIANPTAQGAAALQAAFPEDHEAFKSAWETKDKDQQQADLRELAAIHGYLQSGFADKAAGLIQRRIDADKAAGLDTAEDEDMLDTIKTDPEHAKGATAYMLAAIAGPDKLGATAKDLGDTARADELQPGLVQKGIADADKATTEASMAPQVIQTDIATKEAQAERWRAQTENEIGNLKLGWANLNLDQDKLATETQIKLQELQQTGAQVTGASLDELTKSAGSAAENQALSARSADLAERIAVSGARGGLGSSWAEWLKGTTGNQDAVSSLRTEYSRLTNAAAIKNLPPGSASDKDVAFALKGFPPSAAPPEYLASFLRGMSKLQAVTAEADSRKADWISANGNLGTAKRDLQVGGIRVPAGTTYGEFNANALKRGKAGQPPARSYLEKYGR
jgi:hypothetical protein